MHHYSIKTYGIYVKKSNKPCRSQQKLLLIPIISQYLSNNLPSKQNICSINLFIIQNSNNDLHNWTPYCLQRCLIDVITLFMISGCISLSVFSDWISNNNIALFYVL